MQGRTDPGDLSVERYLDSSAPDGFDAEIGCGDNLERSRSGRAPGQCLQREERQFARAHVRRQIDEQSSGIQPLPAAEPDPFDRVLIVANKEERRTTHPRMPADV